MRMPLFIVACRLFACAVSNKRTPTLSLGNPVLNSFPRKAYLKPEPSSPVQFRCPRFAHWDCEKGLLCRGQILLNTLIGQAASFYHFFLFDENFNSGTLRLSKRRRPLCAQCVPPTQYQAAVPPLPRKLLRTYADQLGLFGLALPTTKRRTVNLSQNEGPDAFLSLDYR